MKPYFEDDAVTIYHGDCREVLPELGPVDLVLTDPPYGELGYEWDTRPVWETLPLPETATAIIFGHQPHLATEILPAMAARGLPFRYEWVWEKPIGRLWNHQRPIRRHELIWCFGDIADSDLREGFGGQHDSIIAAVTYQAYMRAHPDSNGHPTQKPLTLMCAILSAFPVATVLDPFMGSGTTLRAAKDLGRRAIGIEIEERYCEMAAKRMAQAVLPLDPERSHA